MASGDGTRIGSPPDVTAGALKTALSWSAVIPALSASICISFCTVSVSFAAMLEHGTVAEWSESTVYGDSPEDRLSP
jgi:hypothetical protein